MGQKDRMLDAKHQPRGQRSPRQGDYKQDSEFVNRELTVEETAKYRSWRSDFETVEALQSEMIENGYRFTLRYDDRNLCIACFCFPPEGSDNYGFILTGRGGTAYRAASELLYKHAEIFGGDWMLSPGMRNSSEDPEF